MASTTPHTILLYRNGSKEGYRLSAEADEALTPGELVRFDADEELEPHGDSGAVQHRMFVLENPYDDTNTSAAIDSDYATGDTAFYFYAVPGDLVYGWLKAGETVVKGVTMLQSDGAGALEAVTVAAGTLVMAVVGVADEDLTAGVARARLRVRVL